MSVIRAGAIHSSKDYGRNESARPVGTISLPRAASRSVTYHNNDKEFINADFRTGNDGAVLPRNSRVANELPTASAGMAYAKRTSAAFDGPANRTRMTKEFKV